MELGRSHVRVRGRRSFGSAARRERPQPSRSARAFGRASPSERRGSARRSWPAGVRVFGTRPKTRKPSPSEWRARPREPDNACGVFGCSTRPKTRTAARPDFNGVEGSGHSNNGAERRCSGDDWTRGAGRGVTPHPNNGAERRCSGDDPTTALAPCSGCSSRFLVERVGAGCSGGLSLTTTNDERRRARGCSGGGGRASGGATGRATGGCSGARSALALRSRSRQRVSARAAAACALVMARWHGAHIDQRSASSSAPGTV